MLPNSDERPVEYPESITFEKAPLTEEGQQRLEKLLKQPIYRAVVFSLMKKGTVGITGSNAYEAAVLDVTDTSDFEFAAEYMADLDVVWDIPADSDGVEDVKGDILRASEEAGLEDVVIESYADHFYPKFAVYWRGRRMVEVYYAPDCANNITKYRESLGDPPDTKNLSSFDVYSSAQQSVQEGAIIALGVEDEDVVGTLSQVSLPSVISTLPGSISTYREQNPHRLYSSENAMVLLETATTLSELEDTYMTMLKLKLSNLRQVVKSGEQTLYNTSWEEVPDVLDIEAVVTSKAESLGLAINSFSELLAERREWYKEHSSAYVARSIQGNPFKTVSWFRSRNLFAECAPGLDETTKGFFDFTLARGKGSLCIAEVAAPALEASENINLGEVIATFMISAGEFDLENIYTYAKDLEEHWSQSPMAYYGVGIKNPLDTTINAGSIVYSINQFQNGAAYRELVLELQRERPTVELSPQEIGTAFRDKVINDVKYKNAVIQDIASLYAPVDNS